LKYGGPLSVIVVDNDARGREGIAVARSLEPSFPFRIKSEVESTRGQTYAYNRCFRIACDWSDRPDYIAVVDDDEFPGSEWLDRIVAAALDFDADIVGGPVFPVFADPDNWLAKTDLYEPRRYPTGLVPVIYGAGNMLIRRDVLAEYLGEPFPNEYALTGGSDLDFFRRCQKDGRRFAWADDAHVFEDVPTSRLTLRWLLRRAFRGGTDLTRTDRKYAAGTAPSAQRWMKGMGLMVLGVASAPVSASFGRAGLVRSLVTAARGAGRIAAEFGLLHEEYR
jgi:succinoglycan biosynthesis protein ExoM